MPMIPKIIMMTIMIMMIMPPILGMTGTITPDMMLITMNIPVIGTMIFTPMVPMIGMIMKITLMMKIPRPCGFWIPLKLLPVF